MRFCLKAKNKKLLKICMDLMKSIFQEEKIDEILQSIVP